MQYDYEQKIREIVVQQAAEKLQLQEMVIAIRKEMELSHGSS
jgi:hypothetical protein